MSSGSILAGDDAVHDFVLGIAIVATLVAVLVVGLELRGAAAGDPVDPGFVAIAVLNAVTVIGVLAVRRGGD